MTHTFTHRGRRRTIFTRAPHPGASFYLHVQRRGRRLLRSLDTPLKSAAVAKAKLILDALDTNQLAAARALMNRPTDGACATVGQVLDWALTAALDVNEHTRSNYVLCTRNLLRQATGVTDPDTLSTGLLTAETVRAFYRAVTTRAQAAGDQETGNRVRRTANSIANQVRCLFSPRNRADLRDAGLALPDLTGFYEELKVRRFRGVEKRDWRAPDDAVIAATLTAWRQLATLDWDADPLARNTYLAIWLELSCGLRAGEVAQIHWEWFRRMDGVIWLSNRAEVKSGEGYLHLLPLDPHFTEGWLLLIDKLPEPRSGPVLVGNDTERRTDVFRRVGALLRFAGWQTQKTNHALRALSGAWCVRARGIYGAQQFLRHRSVVTTERHYSYLL